MEVRSELSDFQLHTGESELGGMGRASTLVLCSRNARPAKGLVRRPHLDQHGRPSKDGK